MGHNSWHEPPGHRPSEQGLRGQLGASDRISDRTFDRASGPWDGHPLEFPLRGREPPPRSGGPAIASGASLPPALRPPAPPPAPPVGGGSSLRCLDQRHGAACALCRRVPAVGEELDFELVGEVGKKNGEKLLRALITATPEWRSAQARHDAAAYFDTQPDEQRVAAALRSKTSAALRKVNLLALARLWNYRSDLWKPRDRRRAAKAAAGPLESPPLQEAPAEARPSLSCRAQAEGEGSLRKGRHHKI